MSIRRVAGAIVHDLPRYCRAMASGQWEEVWNRAERVSVDRHRVRCEWEFTSELHVCNVFPSLAGQLMKKAFRQWPICLRDSPTPLTENPKTSFIIGHRGLARLPHLLLTLRSIAGQSVPVECVVVEQSVSPEVKEHLPLWVRYLHTPVDPGYEYNRSWTLNAGAKLATSSVLILHDNDMVVPASYAAEAATLCEEGFEFLELKRFIFYLNEEETRRWFASTRDYSGVLVPRATATVVQNLLGASIIARHDAFFAIGGFDEQFVGWGGEDNEFWERAMSRGCTYQFGYLPFVHLWHEPQKGKVDRGSSGGLRRYEELRSRPPEQRIRDLLNSAAVK